MILHAVCALLTAILVVKLFVKASANRRKHQFFREKSPNLPVLKSPNLLLGHANEVVLIERSWAKADEYFAKYGPTFGFYYGTKPAAVTIDLDFIKAYLIDQQDNNDKMTPGTPVHELEVDSVGLASGDQWLRLRRAIAPAFSSHKIKTPNVQAEIGGLIDKFVALIERRLDEAAAAAAAAAAATNKQRGSDQSFIIEDADDICLRYSLGLVFTCFYKQPGAIDFEAKEEPTVAMVRNGFAMLKTTNFLMKVCIAFPAVKPLFNWLLNFDQQGVMRYKIKSYIKKQARQYFQAMKEQEDEQLKRAISGGGAGEQTKPSSADDGAFIMGDGSKFKRNMIDYVNEQYRAGKLTRSEFFNNSFFLFFAANKTSSDAIAKVLHHLACHQAVQDKLRESIRADGIESEYLSWVVNESLRLFPPAPNGASRIMKRDMHTKHGMVPAGTFVITPAYTICRLPEYWGQDANEFKPERWANAKSFHPCQYLVFGGGRRMCPGKELALMETKMLLNVLLRKYKFDRCDQTDDEQLFDSPMFVFLVFDKPTAIKISRL